MNILSKLVLPLTIIVIIAGYFTLFSVDERELVMKFRFGEIQRYDYTPGLYFKSPLENIRKFDKRILTLDALPAQYLTKEKKDVKVDFFVKWRIQNVLDFYKANDRGNEEVARNLIYRIINDGLRAEFSNRSIQEVISGERRDIMTTITNQTNEQVKSLGVEIVDVRIKRIDFSEQISESVFRRMEAERLRVANDYRSRGAEAAEKIRADADRQRTVIHAEAYKESQQLRGDGDGKAAEIYANAYQKDREFFNFYRSLEAYRKSFRNQNDVMVIQPDSEFFDYFKKNKPAR